MGSSRGGLLARSFLLPPEDSPSARRLHREDLTRASSRTGSETTLRPTTRTPLYETIADAAPRLGLTQLALRARCRRGAVREGRDVRCYLGDGVVATKFGRTWRVRFPPA
jgi:hypothetical protein